MKANKYISKLACGLAVAAGICWMSACSDDIIEKSNLTPEQQALIGKGVHFEPYVYGFQTRAYNHDGFNRGDVFYICRQALDESTGKYQPEEKWKSYFYKAYTDPAGNIYKYEWVINLEDKAGFRNTKQTEADSIFWENGKQVRFRAYSKSSCCDDYLYADYAYVSGPMGSVPLEFKHLGCRIGFSPKSGNTIVNVDYCIDPKDYMREDNADSYKDGESTKDETDKFSEDKAKEIAKQVKEVFDQICMPGGLALYSDAGNNWWKRNETTGAEAESNGEVTNPTPQFGVLTAKADGTIAKGEVLGKYVSTDNTMRPNWETNMDGTRYCIMVPYNMQTGAPITIPAETRFKIRLKDVNTNGSEQSYTNYNEEGTNNGGYHIFSLLDIKELDANGNVVMVDEAGNVVTEGGKPKSKYPNGITLRAGYSYTFSVGYRYNQLEVRVNEEGINWNTESDKNTATEAIGKTEVTKEYGWWTAEMKRAADYAMDEEDKGHGDKYDPNFIITSEKEWLEFTNIVNGNLPEGGIEYLEFTPKDGSIAKHTTPKTLTGPFDFAGMNVTLQCNIDFQDREITTIGKNGAVFRGQFNGAGHTLSNFTGSVFGNVEYKGKIYPIVKGLHLKSSQKITLIDKAVCAYIIGISVEGPSDHAITKESNGGCEIIACSHIGIGDQNGSLLGKSEGNKVKSSFIAAAGKGTLTDDGYSGNTFIACYFDRSLSPVTDGYNKYYPNDVYKYEARAVLSQTLRAVIDREPSKLESHPNVDLFYGIAPYKVMNTEIKELYGTKYEYKVGDATNFYDRYPTLEIQEETVTHPTD